MNKDKGLDDITELAEQAKVVAAATGRDEADVLADLLDDGIANNSHRGEEKDLITQLKEAAELITTVQSINAEVSENTVLNGGENKTEVLVETTLDGDIVDRAIASVHRKAENIKKIAIIVIPVFLLLTGGSMEAFGMTNWFGSDDESSNGDEYHIEYGGCIEMSADNYDSQASWDDGSCYWDDGGNTGGGGGPPCDSAWTYDDYSYTQDSNIYIEFNFFDTQDCDIEMAGHFQIYLYQNGNYYNEGYIGDVNFVNFITDFVSFTDLEGGNYDFSIEFHPIECEDEDCDHGSKYTSPHRPNFYIEEDCMASPSYDNLMLIANSDDLTIEVDFQDTNNCGVDIQIMISTYLNKGYQDTVDYDEIQEYWISESGITSIKIENYIGLKDLEDGDWEIEFRFKTINTNTNDYEDCCQMSNEVVIDEIEDIVYGCTDLSADNYNELATDDDDSCTYPPPEICEINLFNIQIGTNETHASVGFDLDCGYESNDLEGYNVTIQFLVYDINSTNSSTPYITYEVCVHYIQGWVSDNNYLTLTDFVSNNTTHYDFYWYAIWTDGYGEQQMMEQQWLNREMNS